MEEVAMVTAYAWGKGDGAGGAVQGKENWQLWKEKAAEHFREIKKK